MYHTLLEKKLGGIVIRLLISYSYEWIFFSLKNLFILHNYTLRCWTNLSNTTITKRSFCYIYLGCGLVLVATMTSVKLILSSGLHVIILLINQNIAKRLKLQRRTFN